MYITLRSLIIYSFLSLLFHLLSPIVEEDTLTSEEKEEEKLLKLPFVTVVVKPMFCQKLAY